ncbi:hypothetical protein DMENIID0001_169060 [Sergentomyia squamirostris]
MSIDAPPLTPLSGNNARGAQLEKTKSEWIILVVRGRHLIRDGHRIQGVLNPSQAPPVSLDNPNQLGIDGSYLFLYGKVGLGRKVSELNECHTVRNGGILEKT